VDAIDFDGGSCVIEPIPGRVRERLGWTVVRGVRLFAASCEPHGPPRARVLLLPPVGAERERAHRTLVVVARALARGGCATVRFDHRGNGESEGAFEDATFGEWIADARALAASAARDGAPLVLLGVRGGATVASELFTDGVGDGLLQIGAMGARTLLLDMARRAAISSLVETARGAATAPEPGTSRSATDRLRRGEPATVDGHRFTPRLWNEAAAHPLRQCGPLDLRPWARIEPTPHPRPAPELAGHLVRVGFRRFWESGEPLVEATDPLIDAITGWFDAQGDAWRTTPWRSGPLRAASGPEAARPSPHAAVPGPALAPSRDAALAATVAAREAEPRAAAAREAST
jgi:pimeloyl-ACP methyl ester carboxylesterase